MSKARNRLRVPCRFDERQHTGDKAFQGTCFFVLIDGYPVLVTNRHNVDAHYKDEKYKCLKLKTICFEGYFDDDLFHKITVRNCSICTPNNDDEDIAAVVFQGDQLIEPAGKAFPNSFALHDIANVDWLQRNLRICDMVAFPSYPKFHDWNGSRPIMRVGTIASDPASDYRWKSNQNPARRMAYEAMSFGGSSGCPVIALPKLGIPGETFDGKNYRSPCVIGINSGHLVDDEDFLKQHSGISYFFKSSALVDLLSDAQKVLAAGKI